MSAGADATRARELADFLESEASAAPLYSTDARFREAAALLRRLAAAPAKENTELVDALRWLVNLACGVGKAGGKPEDYEIEEAVAAGKAALGRARPEPEGG